jgi:cardiolipin synthase A/B
MSPARTSPPAASAALAGDPGAGVEGAVQRFFAPHLDSARGARLAGAWRKTLRLLRPLGAVSLGNRVRVLVDGDEVFEAMWAAIAAARESVHLASYILEPDRVGTRTLQELELAAERGCRVLLLLDAFGSHRVSEASVARLRALGATVVFFNPIVRWSTPFSRLVRNHKKILVVDQRLSFCGGMNVAEEYAGPRHGNALFRDAQLALEGPCARDLAWLCERDVLEGLHLATHAGAGPTSVGPGPGGSLVQILDSHVRRHRRAIQKALRVTLGRALERCYLSSPYFVPPKRLMSSLQHAARRGVDVRVLTAGRSDVPLVRLASQHLYGRLLRAGVRIFELHARVLHAKTVTVDGVYASVGSFNLDYWSDRRNLEVSVSVLDRGAACALEEQFQRDLEGAREVRLEGWARRTWLQRFASWLAYQALRL